MRLRHLVAPPLAAALFAASPGVVGHAAVALSGAIEFDGVARLSTSPCVAAPCDGTVSAAWSGRLTGISGTAPFEVTWRTGGTGLNAAVVFTDGDCTAATGTATGHGTATAMPGQIMGTWQVPGDVFARAITAATMTFDLHWSRTGSVATLELQPLSIALDVNGLGLQTVLASPQHGVIAFGTVPAPTCATPQRDVTVTVAATVPVSAIT
jgi:hypothetical protein